MARLLVHVEGQTEETFVNEILRDHLVEKGYDSVSARIVGNARLRQHRGGICSWPSVKQDIVRHLRGDAGCVATTLVDFYGLPQHGKGAWPGRAEAARLPSQKKATCVEAALLGVLDGEGISERFVPFVVMYEFEALLFSDCAGFSRGMGLPELEPDLKKIRQQFGGCPSRS